MDIATIKPLVIAALTDWRVIVIGILGILFIKFANFVTNYDDKPQKKIKNLYSTTKHIAAKKAEAKKTEEETNDEE